MTCEIRSLPVRDEAAMDPTIPATEDFYRHANGTWLANYEIPADRASDGVFYALSDRAESDVHAIIESLDAGSDDSDETKLAVLYRQFMDETAIEKAGYRTLIPDFAAILAASTHDALARAMAQLARTGVTSIVQTMIYPNLNQPTHNGLYFYQDGLALPDEAYYRDDEHAGVREAYVTFLNRMAQLLATDSGLPEQVRTLNDNFGRDVLDFETQVAALHWDNVASRDVEKTNNPTALQDLITNNPGFAWVDYFDALGITTANNAKAVIYQPSFIEGMCSLWASTSLDVLKRWAIARVVTSRAMYLTKDAVDAHFEFSRTLSGATELRPRWKRAVAFVEDAMGFALGRFYVDRHFPQSYKEQMLTLVNHLIDAYRESISQLEWMSDATRSRALEKLSLFTPKIGFPDAWRDYSTLTTGVDLVDSVRRTRDFEWRRQCATIDQPVDREEWLMTPQTVNAYYMPTMNEIAFPAAILQPPFFDPDAPDAVNYGAIGAVIGHEIGHGFDDQGSLFDGHGQQNNWWEAEDRERFTERTRALIAQYDAFSPAQLSDDHHVNGALTIGENIGDLGGLTIAWKAYLLALRERGIDNPDDDTHEGLTGAEQFFYSWAKAWRSKARDEYAIQLLTVDPHSPAEFRCNGVVRNLALFHDTFHTAPGDGMWLAPEDRVSIW